jgi:hypothetical protein
METTLTLGQRQQNSDTRMVEAVAKQNQTSSHIYPTHGTQAARFLAAMLAGRQINPLASWVEFGIYRTSDVVLRLRKAGWPIDTDDLPVKNTFGEDCVVGLYSLAPEAIAQSGSEAQQFIADEREVLRAMRGAA